jgi:hypothetical protein
MGAMLSDANIHVLRADPAVCATRRAEHAGPQNLAWVARGCAHPPTPDSSPDSASWHHMQRPGMRLPVDG